MNDNNAHQAKTITRTAGTSSPSSMGLLKKTRQRPPPQGLMIFLAIFLIVVVSFYKDWKNLHSTNLSESQKIHFHQQELQPQPQAQSEAAVALPVGGRRQEQQQGKNEDEEWKQVSVNIPIRWKSNQRKTIDIYINQQNPKRVYRGDCHGQFQNEIVYSYANFAGMNDRRSAITYMSELAAFLCATLKIHNPSTLLAAQHNGGKKVSTKLRWSDFLVVKPNDIHYDDYDHDVDDNTSSFFTFLQERGDKNGMTSKFRLPSHQFSDIEEGNIDINNTIFFTSSKRSFVSSFDKAFEISVSPNNNSFSWTIPTNMYNIRDNFKDYLWQIQRKNNDNNNTTLYLPWIDYVNDATTKYSPNYWRGYDYTQKNLVPPFFLEGIQQMIPGILEQGEQQRPSNNSRNATTAGSTTATNILGTWHIRRGDGKAACDTELESRLSKYIPCTFNDKIIARLGLNQQQIILLIQTDETDTKYLHGLQKLFDPMKSFVRVVFLDQYIAKHPTWQSYWPTSYRNNYHRFEIGNHILELLPELAFQLVHRWHHDCKDCYVDLQNDLDRYWSSQKQTHLKL